MIIAEIKTWSVPRTRNFLFRISSDGSVIDDYAGELDVHFSYGFSLTESNVNDLLHEINTGWVISDGVSVDRYTALLRDNVDSISHLYAAQGSPKVELMVEKVFPYIRREIDDYNAAFRDKIKTESAVRAYILDRIRLNVASEFGLTSP